MKGVDHYSRSIVAECCKAISGVTGAYTDLVSEAIAGWEELLGDVRAVCQLAIVASSKQEQACGTRVVQTEMPPCLTNGGLDTGLPLETCDTGVLR